MRLKPGQELPESDTAGPQRHAVYRVTKPLCESAFYSFYEAKRFYWNVDRKTGGKGKLCEEDDALQVVLKTFLYSRPDDRDHVKARRAAYDQELAFLKTRTTNLLPEPLDELRVSNDDDEFSFSHSGSYRRNEPVLVFKKVHGRRLTDLILSEFPTGLPFERAEPLLLEIIEFLGALRRTTKDKRTSWSCCNLSPDQLLVDPSYAVYVTGTGSVWPIRSGSIELPPPDLRRSALGFCAPEVLAGRSADGRADLHAWGALAAFVLTGRQPTPRPDRSASLDAATLERLGRPEIPHAVGALIERCLAPDPNERPDDVDTLARWWHSPPPARPRWAVGLFDRPRQVVKLLIGGASPRVEVSLGGAPVARGRASPQAPIEIGGVAGVVGLEVRSLASDAEDDRAERSGPRAAQFVDIADEDAIRRAAAELAAISEDAIGALVQHGGAAARRALTRSTDPTLRLAALAGGIAARDVRGVLEAIQQEQSPDARFAGASRAFGAFGKDVSAELEAAVIPVEPWPAVESALKRLEQFGSDKAWLADVRNRRWADQKIPCPACQSSVRRANEGEHLRGHGWIALGERWLSFDDWTRAMRERMETTGGSEEVAKLYSVFEDRSRMQEGVALLAGSLQRNPERMAAAIRSVPKAALAVTEAMLFCPEKTALAVVPLVTRLLAEPHATGALLRLGTAHSSSIVREASARVLVAAAPDNSRRLLEVARRLVKAEHPGGLSTEAEVAAVEVALHLLRILGAHASALAKAKDLARGVLPLVCTRCRATVAMSEMDGHAASAHQERFFRGTQGAPTAILELAVKACEADPRDEAAAEVAVSVARSCAGTLDAREALGALFRLRRLGVRSQEADAAIQEVSPWIIAPSRIESAACEVTLSGILAPRAHCVLRTEDGNETVLEVSPRVRPSLIACVALGALAGSGIPLLLHGQPIHYLVLGIVGALAGVIFKLICLLVDHGDARDVVLYQLLGRFHEAAFDRLQGAFLARILRDSPLPRGSDGAFLRVLNKTVTGLRAGTARPEDVWPLLRVASHRGLDTKCRIEGLALLSGHALPPDASKDADLAITGLDDRGLVAYLEQLHEPAFNRSNATFIARLARCRPQIPALALERLQIIHERTARADAALSIKTLQLVDRAGSARRDSDGADAFAHAFLLVFQEFRRTQKPIDARLDEILADDDPWTACTRVRSLVCIVPGLMQGELARLFPRAANLIATAGGDVVGWERGLRRLALGDTGSLANAIEFQSAVELPPKAWRQHARQPDLLAVSGIGSVTSKGIVVRGQKMQRDPRPVNVTKQEMFVRTGWTYENKDGSADRRRRDNPARGYNALHRVTVNYSGGNLDFGRDLNGAETFARQLDLLAGWAFS
jgi:serine/threonine protein kinase